MNTCTTRWQNATAKCGVSQVEWKETLVDDKSKKVTQHLAVIESTLYVHVKYSGKYMYCTGER